jgi:hypothetical protein
MYQHVKWITFAYKTSIHSSTGVSPFRMLYGEEAILPPDRTLHVIRTGVPNEDQYLQSLDNRIKEMYSIVNKNIEKNNYFLHILVK